MRTALIYHAGDPISGEGLSRWLSSFSDVVGLIEIAEPKRRLWKRIRREWKRSGPLGFLDVVAFRLFYRIWLAKADRTWETQALDQLRTTYPNPSQTPPILRTESPNSPETEAFLRQHAPDLMIARCKSLLRKKVFSIPTHGTFVLHPGICPDYRNAHGCFWALAQKDFSNVGMTLLRIDEGIDTGPVFAHYRWEFDQQYISHIVIQNKLLIDNLASIKESLLKISQGTATPIDTRGRPSHEWGQPWLSAYLRWRRAAIPGRKP